jgi:aminomethyltransferase
VDLDKESDFIGKRALTRIAEEGVTRKVVGVEIGGDPIIGYLDDYLPVLDGRVRIGQVSSAFWSPRLEKNIGFALVPVEWSENDTPLTVRTAARGDVGAVVVPRPFVDPKKETPKGLQLTGAVR